ncbi:MAG: sulfatase [Alphaproteobacteria bacterium]|nr:sulfatase [Alphaproteobacteria bacterium]
MRALKIALDGVTRGVLSALAMCISEAGGMIFIWNVSRGFPLSMEAYRWGSAQEVVLGAILGLVLSPALLAPRGRALHALGLIVVWVGLAWVFPPVESSMVLSLAPAVGGSMLYLGGLGLATRWPRASVGLGATTLALVLTLPEFFLGGARSVEATRPDAVAEGPDVVLVVMDTVRASSVSAYGYPVETTPHFDRLAAEGALFKRAVAPSTWSLPSHASFFTGHFTSAHGGHSETGTLDEALPTLADVFAEAGYETALFSANPHLSDAFGLARGYRFEDQAWRGDRTIAHVFTAHRLLAVMGYGEDDKGGGRVAGNFERWVARRPADAPPAFVTLNFLEAHAPYEKVPEPFLSRFTDRPHAELADVSNLAMADIFNASLTPEDVERMRVPMGEMYHASVAYTDHLLSRVVDALRARGSLDDTVLIVLADHGELLGEHNRFGHGRPLYEPDLWVPLMIRYPAAVPAGVAVDQPVSTVGVMATALALAGLDAPPVQVGSLLPALRGEPAGQPLIVERYRMERGAPTQDPMSMPDQRYRVYYSGPWKLVTWTGGPPMLFDLAADPTEDHDLADQDPAQRAALEAELDGWATRLGLPPLDAAAVEGEGPKMDEETRDRLEALGYVE